MKNRYKKAKEFDKKFMEQLNLELKFSYLLSDIMYSNNIDRKALHTNMRAVI